MRLPFFRAKNKAPPPAARPAMMGDDAEVQAARTKARRRLVGALVLLVVGVVGFPLLFETQPRPLAVDTPIFVPEGTPMRAAAAPASAARLAPALPSDAGAESNVKPVELPAFAPSAPASAAAPQPAPAPVAKPVQVAAPNLAPKLASNPAPAPAPAASAAAAAARFVVQVGAYNDVDRLKAARAKLEKLGYKSYTQDVDSSTGKRTRVRVGPYASKQEAEAVAAKLKAAGMQAAILLL